MIHTTLRSREERRRLNEMRKRRPASDFTRESHCRQCGVPLLFYEELTHCGPCVEKAKENFYLCYVL
jgi:hypothetical protein